jgi:ABC-type antimicrobial peptide transport system permease subunit
MYLSLHQVEDAGSWDMMVRTKLPVATLTAELRDALHELDPTLPLSKVRPMQSLVDRTLSSRRLLVWLIGGFATIAVGLAGIGLYGVISYMVAQQTKEIGIRMALGAEASTVRWQIVRRTMKLALVGLMLGLVVAFAAGRGMQSLLYGVASDDPIVYLMAASLLLGCAFAAGYLPARRASRVNPVIALRAD